MIMETTINLFLKSTASYGINERELSNSLEANIKKLIEGLEFVASYQLK